jgi:hypothetical protein
LIFIIFYSNHWLFIAFIFTFYLYLLCIILISCFYMSLTLTTDILTSQKDEAESLIPKFMAGHLSLETLQDLYLGTLIVTMSIAVIFFVSVTSLIRVQVPFLFGPDPGPRKRAWSKDHRVMMGRLDTPTVA